MVWIGQRLFGPIGALGGWICAEESCRLILLHRAARLFKTSILGALPRDLWLQLAAAAMASPLAAFALHMASGPLLVQLCICGLSFSIVYLVALRAMGVLPPVRAWIPQRRPALAAVQEAA